MKLLRENKRRSRTSVTSLAVLALLLPLVFVGNALAAQAPVPVGNAGTFGALSATAMTNAGLNTVVTGHVGSSTSVGAGVTNPGFSSYGAGSTQLANAQASLLTAYGNAEAQTPTGNITGMNLAGQTLTPGVYNSTGSILISGPTPLTLNGNGNADSVFIFQAAASGDLTVDPTSNVVFTNGAQPCNVFWKVQSAFLKNTGFTFVGTIFALTQITLTDNITVQGRLLARNADVTFIHDTVNVPSTCVSQADIDSANAQVLVECFELELGEGELARVPASIRRQLVNRFPGPCTIVAIGASGEHQSRDAEAFVDWNDSEGRPPQDVPLPADIPGPS